MTAKRGASVTCLAGVGRLPGTLVLGIGNRLRGDDGVGALFAERCAARGLAAIDCGDVPENHLARLARERPDLVIIADAADFGAEPGETAVFESEDLAGSGVATHGMPVGLIADHIKELCGARVLLLGFQPKNLGFGCPMSAEVAAAASRCALTLEGAGSPHALEVTP